VRLGGFVIHGDAAATLPRCLESLRAVCDDLVAVDSCSSDGSADLSRAAGARVLVSRWRGYGAARAAAAGALAGCDYVFFLDSDEYLLEPARERLRAWKAAGGGKPYYRLTRRDWAELPDRRFLFRSERHVRVIRADHARWEARMVVHEALPRGPEVEDLGAFVEHRFVDALEVRRAKEERYALLWALRARAEGWPRKPPALERAAHALRNALVKGAALRGGRRGLALAWSVSRYHARKHAHLAAVERGAHADMLAALREGRLEELFALLDAFEREQGGGHRDGGGAPRAR
jgi:glycosyltransferase involved in cell wall biosynthesis